LIDLCVLLDVLFGFINYYLICEKSKKILTKFEESTEEITQILITSPTLPEVNQWHQRLKKKIFVGKR